VVIHQRVPFSYFFLLVFFEPFFLALFFWYRVFLPLAIFGRILRTFSMSLALQTRTWMPPTRSTLGAEIFRATRYR